MSDHNLSDDCLFDRPEGMGMGFSPRDSYNQRPKQEMRPGAPLPPYRPSPPNVGSATVSILECGLFLIGCLPYVNVAFV